MVHSKDLSHRYWILLDRGRIPISPSATFGEWRGHFIYRVVSGSISTALLRSWVLSLATTGAGLLGSWVDYNCGFSSCPYFNSSFDWPHKYCLRWGTSAIDIYRSYHWVNCVGFIGMGIGFFFGKIGCRLAEDKSADLVRYHNPFLLAMGSHLSLWFTFNFSIMHFYMNSFYFWSCVHSSFFCSANQNLPVVIFAAPLYFGLALLSGKVQKNWPGWLQQLSGFVITFAGIVVFNMIAYLVMSGS